ncbi:MAG: hypothetical protein U1G07_24155 [Verrucomicrobiota bacterium]
MKEVIKILSVALICSRLTTPLWAQPVPVQQYNEQQQNRLFQEPFKGFNASTNAPELYPGENEDVGPQAILRLRAKRTLFEAVADTQYLYTDNNRLSEDHKIDTGLAINTVQFALAPSSYPIGPGQFSPRVGFRSQWYNYGLGAGRGEDVLDFNAQTVFAIAQYRYNQKWDFGVEFDYTRLLDQDHYNEFYTEFTPSLFAQRIFSLNDRLLFAVSWQGMYHFTTVDPFPRSDVNDRLDNTLGLTLSYRVIDDLVLQPFYRFQHTYYPETAFNTSRNDYLNIVGTAVSYYFTPQFAARVFVTGSFRESDDSHTSSYEKFDAGVGASFVLRF